MNREIQQEVTSKLVHSIVDFKSEYKLRTHQIKSNQYMYRTKSIKEN